MAKARVRLNPAGITAMLKSPGLRDELERRASNAAERARSSAPVESGNYKNSITSGSEEHPSRLVGRVYANAPYALIVERNHNTLSKSLGGFKD